MFENEFYVKIDVFLVYTNELPKTKKEKTTHIFRNTRNVCPQDPETSHDAYTHRAVCVLTMLARDNGSYSNGIILNPKVDGTIAIFDISGRQNFIREVFSNETINVEISQISRGLQIIHFTPQNQSNETFAPQTWKVVIPS